MPVIAAARADLLTSDMRLADWGQDFTLSRTAATPVDVKTTPGGNVTVTVPNTRACVHCGKVNEYGGACKHIRCRYCLQPYCHVCLAKGHGIAYDWCKPADRQTADALPP